MRLLIGFGGNLGAQEQLEQRFARAATLLERGLPVVEMRWSGHYISAPVGPVTDQPRFRNAVLQLRTSAPVWPVFALELLLHVEHVLLRTRAGAVAKGPRTIDLDLLFADAQQYNLIGPPALQLPHPRIAARAFVLRPLADLMGEDWHMPGIGRSIADCLRQPQVARQQLYRVQH